MKNFSNNSENGNVLFLILIAVALFAALSYAVTQSTRSTAGNTNRETAILNSASLTQYPAVLRTSVARMGLNGVGVESLEFNPPADFLELTSNNVGVFHPDGGGGVFQVAPGEVMANGELGTWYFNADWAIPQIGVDLPGVGNDVIAFLPGVSRTICRNINKKVNINLDSCNAAVEGIPDLAVVTDNGLITSEMVNGYIFPTTAESLQGDGSSCEAFSGQPMGCFTDTEDDDKHVFFSVLLER